MPTFFEILNCITLVVDRELAHLLMVLFSLVMHNCFISHSIYSSVTGGITVITQKTTYHKIDCFHKSERSFYVLTLVAVAALFSIHSTKLYSGVNIDCPSKLGLYVHEMEI